MRGIAKSRFWKLSFLIGLLLTLGFGCKGLSTTEKQLIQPVTLEYWTVFDDVDGIKKLVEQYRATGRPYINVNVRQLRAEELYPRLVEELAEDRGPDIISVHSRSLKNFQSKLAPMPASVEDAIVKVETGQLGTKTTVIPQTRNLPTLSQLSKEYVQAVGNEVVLDGNIYGLPLSLDTMAIYYNEDLLDRSGVPEPPKNWDEFQAAVKKITKYDKKTGKVIQSGAALGTGNNVSGFDDLLYILFKQSGVGFTLKSNGYAVFNSAPKNAERGTPSPSMSVVDFYTDFANPARDTYSWSEDFDGALERFVNGSVGFFFGYSYHLPLIKARAPQLNLGIIPLFQLNSDQPVNVANFWVQTVVGKSRHQQEAWALIDYLAHSKATKDYLDATGRPTAIRTFISAQQEKLELDPFVSQVLVAESWYHGRNYEAAQKALGDLLRDWLKGTSDEDKVLQWKQELLNRAAAKVNQTL